jgi:hypothetical protein
MSSEQRTELEEAARRAIGALRAEETKLLVACEQLRQAIRDDNLPQTGAKEVASQVLACAEGVIQALRAMNTFARGLIDNLWSVETAESEAMTAFVRQRFGPDAFVNEMQMESGLVKMTAYSSAAKTHCAQVSVTANTFDEARMKLRELMCQISVARFS